VVAGADGYFYVGDTLGGALLVYQLASRDLRLVSRVGLGRSTRPYGLAADPEPGWVFVTLTGTDQLMGLRLRGPRVTSRVVWATARQPNSVAVDPSANSVVDGDTSSNQVGFVKFAEGS
jgi:hypothetical protein